MTIVIWRGLEPRTLNVDTRPEYISQFVVGLKCSFRSGCGGSTRSYRCSLVPFLQKSTLLILSLSVISVDNEVTLARKNSTTPPARPLSRHPRSQHIDIIYKDTTIIIKERGGSLEQFYSGRPFFVTHSLRRLSLQYTKHNIIGPQRDQENFSSEARVVVFLEYPLITIIPRVSRPIWTISRCHWLISAESFPCFESTHSRMFPVMYFELRIHSKYCAMYTHTNKTVLICTKVRTKR